MSENPQTFMQPEVIDLEGISGYPVKDPSNPESTGTRFWVTNRTTDQELNLFPDDTVSYEVFGARIVDEHGQQTWERPKELVRIPVSEIDTIEQPELRRFLKLQHINNLKGRDHTVIMFNTEIDKVLAYTVPRTHIDPGMLWTVDGRIPVEELPQKAAANATELKHQQDELPRRTKIALAIKKLLHF